MKAKTEAKLAKEKKTSENKKKRAKAKQDRISQANGLGAGVSAALKSQEQARKLKVPELKACLTFKGISFDKTAKKAELVDLLISKMDLPVSAPPESESSQPIEADTSAENVVEDGNSDHESDSDSEEESEDEADLLF